MPGTSRDYTAKDAIIQGATELTHTFDTETEPLYSQSGPTKTLSWLAGSVQAIKAALGFSRGHFTTKFQGPDRTLTGTYTSTGTAVAGTGSLFLSEVAVGDMIKNQANEYREVQAIADNTHLTLWQGFTADAPGGTAVIRQRNASERFDGYETLIATFPVAPTVDGQVPRSNGSGAYIPTLPHEFIKEYLIRTGSTVAVEDVVSFYGTTGTIEKNGKSYKQYSSTQIATTPTASNAAKPKVIALDATHFVVLYSDEVTNFQNIKGNYCTLNANRTITVASAVTIAANGVTVAVSGAPFTACVLDSTHFVVGYPNQADSKNLNHVCTVSAGTFTVGSSQDSGTASTGCHRISAMSSSKIIQLSGSDGASFELVVGTVSGSVITYGSPVAFPSTYADPAQEASDIIAVSSSSAIACLWDGSDLFFFQITVSGTTPTILQAAKDTGIAFGSSAGARGDQRSMTLCLSEDSDIVIGVFRRAAGAGYGPVVFALYAQTSVQWPTGYLGGIAGIEYHQIADIAGWVNNGAVLFYTEFPDTRGDSIIVSNGNLLVVGLGVVPPNGGPPLMLMQVASVGYGTELLTPSVRQSGINVKIQPSRSRTINFVDGNTSASTYAHCSIANLDPSTSIAIFLTNNGSTVSVMAIPIEYHRVIGICKQAGTGDGVLTSRIQFDGLVSGLSGLVTGRQYFAGDLGTLSLRSCNWEMGQAISSTELQMEKREILI